MAYPTAPIAVALPTDGGVVVNNVAPRPQGAFSEFYREDDGVFVKIGETLDTDGIVDLSEGTYKIRWVDGSGNLVAESNTVSGVAGTAVAVGDLAWRLSFKDFDAYAPMEHPATYNGYVYVGVAGVRYKIDAVTGRIERSYKGVPDLQWTGNYWISPASPVLCTLDGSLCVLDVATKWSGSGSYLALYRDDGTFLWRVPLSYRTDAEGIGYDGSAVYVSSPTGLRKYRLSDGALVWSSTATDDFSFCAPTYDAVTDSVFVYSRSGYARKISAASGASVSSVVTTGYGAHYGTMMIVDDANVSRAVVWAGRQGRVFRASADTFTSILASYTIPDAAVHTYGVGDTKIGAAITYYDGVVYFGALTNYFYAVNVSTMSLVWKSRPTATAYDEYWTALWCDGEKLYYPSHRYGGILDLAAAADNPLLVLDKDTGALLDTISGPQLTSSCFNPMITHGHLLTGSWILPAGADGTTVFSYKVLAGTERIDSMTYRGSEKRLGSTLILTITPSVQNTIPLGTITFTCEANGAAVTPVWSATGGTITEAGEFTAGATGGGWFTVTAEYEGVAGTYTGRVNQLFDLDLFVTADVPSDPIPTFFLQANGMLAASEGSGLKQTVTILQETQHATAWIQAFLYAYDGSTDTLLATSQQSVFHNVYGVVYHQLALPIEPTILALTDQLKLVVRLFAGNVASQIDTEFLTNSLGWSRVSGNAALSVSTFGYWHPTKDTVEWFYGPHSGAVLNGIQASAGQSFDLELSLGNPIDTDLTCTVREHKGTVSVRDHRASASTRDHRATGNVR